MKDILENEYRSRKNFNNSIFYLLITTLFVTLNLKAKNVVSDVIFLNENLYFQIGV